MYKNTGYFYEDADQFYEIYGYMPDNGWSVDDPKQYKKDRRDWKINRCSFLAQIQEKGKEKIK